MENLEKTLGELRLKVEETSPLFTETTLYEGLKKLGDKAYAGPTSIKYWM